MNKREKQSQLEEKIEELKEEIRREEEKLRNKIINSNKFTENPKDSKSIIFDSQNWFMREQTQENSKNILIESSNKVQNNVSEKWRDNDTIHFENSSDSKENNDMGLRVTASSIFRQNPANISEDCSYSINHFWVKRQNLLTDGINNFESNVRQSPLQVIEDATINKIQLKI